MQTQQNRTIGILGGMGPLATVDLFRRIVEMADSPNDQGHPRVLIDSNTNISDRTAAILNGGADPLPEMVRSALLLERGGADVLIMGCNTAHYFYPEICRFVHLPFLNMLEETAKAALDKGFKSVGLLATDGTIRSGVYAREFEHHGIELLTPGPEGQTALMEMIYLPDVDGRRRYFLRGYDRKLTKVVMTRLLVKSMNSPPTSGTMK